MNASVEGAAASPEVVPDDVTDAPHSELLSRIDEKYLSIVIIRQIIKNFLFWFFLYGGKLFSLKASTGYL